MGIRFRKSFKLAPGIRMNLSGGGASFGFGPRGASVSVGSRGVYSNVGIPGTGLSSRQKLSGGGDRNASTHRTQPSVAAPRNVSMAVSVGVRDDGDVYFQNESGEPLPDHLVAIAKKQQGDAIRNLIQKKCDEINAQIEAVGDLHLNTPAPENRPVFVSYAYGESCPIAPAPKVPGFFAKLFASRRAKAEAENREARQRHQSHVAEWEAGLATHQRTEEQRRKRIEELIYTDPEAMESHLEETLQEIAWPRETLVATELLANGSTVFIDVDFPEIEDMPNKTAGVPSRGMKLSVKEMSPTQVQRLYMRHIHSIGFRIIGEAFAALPKTNRVVVSGYSQRREKATGHVNDEYLYSVQVDRPTWREIDFSKSGLKEIDPVDALSRFSLRRTMSKTGVFKPIVPFSAEDVKSD